MDLITLAMAMQNGGGGGAGAPMIVPGELAISETEDVPVVVIDAELADIYAAAESGRPVFLEWRDGGDGSLLQLVKREYDDEEETYKLTFGASIVTLWTPCVVSVTYDNSKEGILTLAQMNNATTDVHIVHDANTNTWSANEFDINLLTTKRSLVNVRAVMAGGSLKNYFVLSVNFASDYIVVELLDLDQSTPEQDRHIALAVFPDGTVMTA